MDPRTLAAISRLRHLSQSDVARLSGVSRQAVSRWFLGSDPNPRLSHVLRLSAALGISAEDLARPLPVLGDAEAARRYEAALLWDHLYPDLVEFSVALVKGEAPALARLVEVFGLYRATKIAGRKIWDRFPAYKDRIKPVRRRQLERLWAER